MAALPSAASERPEVTVRPRYRAAMRTLRFALAQVAAAAAGMFAVFVVASFASGHRPIDGPLGEGGGAGRSRGWLTARGVYPAELDTASGRSFTWTRTSGKISVPALDRREPRQVLLAVRGIPAQQDRPAQTLTLTVDGVVASRVTLTGEPQSLVVPIPASARTGVSIGFSLSHGFVPGPQDPRELGMIVDRIAIAPAEGRRWPVFTPAAGRALMLAVLAGVSLTLFGVPGRAGAGLAFLAGAGTALLLAIDGAILGGFYQSRLLPLHLAVLVVAGLTAFIRFWWPGSFDAAARIGICIVAVVLLLRAGVFLHPQVTVGDSIFHVHRAELVARGHYLFTSITPRPFFEFPYPPGLYVTAMPAWDAYPDKLDRARLLRMIVLAVDALATLALFAAVRRYWGAGPALIAAGLHQIVPIGLHTVCTSNLTNAFAQSSFTFAVALALWLMDRVPWLVWTLLLAVLAAVAFLSHFSTLATGVPVLLAVAGCFAIGRREKPGAAAGVAVALALSLLGSYLVYYSHFHEVFRTTAARVLARQGEAEKGSMVAPVSVKARRALRALRHEYYGVPLTLAALAGSAIAIRRKLRDPLALAVAGWVTVVIAFLGLGIVTPIEMRAALTGQAPIVALAGLALAAVWQRGWPGRLAATLVLLLVAGRGLHDWLLCLGQI